MTLERLMLDFDLFGFGKIHIVNNLRQAEIHYCIFYVGMKIK